MKKILTSVIILASLLFAPIISLASNGGAQHIVFGPYLSSAGVLYPTPQVYHYAAGTTNTKNCWSDELRTSAAAQPFVGDTSGIARMYCDGDYKFVIKDSGGNTLYTWDAVKVTSDTATMWEGNQGTSYPSASAANKGQLFELVDGASKLIEIGINDDGSGFSPIILPINIVQAEKYTSFAAAVTAIGSATKTLLVTTPQTISSAVVVPSNVNVFVLGIGTFTKSGSGTLEFNGPVSFPLKRIFIGFGVGGTTDIVFKNGSVSQVFPEYWEINTTPGTTDMYTAVQGAINSIKATGGEIYFHSITYKITGTLAITDDGITLAGANKYSSILNFNNGALDDITVIGSSGNNVVGFQMHDLHYTHTSKTGGRALVLAFTHRDSIRDIFIDNAWTGFEIWINNDTFIENVIFQGITGGASVPASYFGSYAPQRTYGIWWHAQENGTGSSNELTTFMVTVSAANSGSDGFVWSGNATTWNIERLTALNTYYGMHIYNQSGSGTYFPSFAAAHNFITDGSQKIGLYIEAGGQFGFSDSWIQNTSGASGQGGADTNAVKILPDTGKSETRNITFQGGRIGLSKEDALYISARNVIVDGVTFATGGTQTTNTMNAIHVLSPSDHITITSNQASVFGMAVAWKYGMLVDSGVTSLIAVGNDFTLAGTKEIQNNTTNTESLIFGNLSSQGLSLNPISVGIPGAKTVTGSFTATGIQIVGGVLNLTGAPGAPFNLTTPTAAELVTAIRNPVINQVLDLLIVNDTASVATLVAGASVTLTPAAITVGANSSRIIKIFISATGTGIETVTIYG